MNFELKISANSPRAVVKPSGDLMIRTAERFYQALLKLIADPKIETVEIDFGQVQNIDSSAIAVVAVIKEKTEARNKQLEICNLAPAHRQAFQLMPSKPIVEAENEEQSGFLEWFGEQGIYAVEQGQRFFELLTQVAVAIVDIFRRKYPPRRAVIEQCVHIGVTALPIVLLLSFLLGLILAFQAAYQLRQFGANIYVANLVGISMMREFGPMMTAIIIAGRSGSAIAAELGTMAVQEEIDALRTMGIEPQRYLVLPRLIALSVMQPSLTLMANLVGIFGGFLIGTMYLDISAPAYLHQTFQSMDVGDVTHALTKSLIFAWIIGLVGCFFGLTIRGGASAVGRATTRAVVTSIFLIIVVDSTFAMVSTLIK